VPSLAFYSEFGPLPKSSTSGGILRKSSNLNASDVSSLDRISWGFSKSNTVQLYPAISESTLCSRAIWAVVLMPRTASMLTLALNAALCRFHFVLALLCLIRFSVIRPAFS